MTLIEKLRKAAKSIFILATEEAAQEISTLFIEAADEIEKFHTKYFSELETIDEFKTAAGLNVGGDPSGVTPELLAEYISKLNKVVELVRKGQISGHSDLQAALAALPKEE